MIGTPVVGDAVAVARMHLRAWYETYDRAGSGVDAAWIAQHLGHLATGEGAAGWAAEIMAARREPERAFCRVVRPDTEIRADVDAGSHADTEIRADADADSRADADAGSHADTEIRADAGTRADADNRAGTGTRVDADNRAGTGIRAGAFAGSGVVGFLYGHRTGAGTVTLGPMYLLEVVQGTGVAHALMGEFLDWAGATPIRLWVSEFNARAVRFYARYGFVATGERELWRGRLRNLRMVRSAGAKL